MPLYIPPATSRLIRDLNLDEWTIEDVYETGNSRPGMNMKFKKYEQRGYTVQISFKHNSDTGEDVITYIKKW